MLLADEDERSNEIAVLDRRALDEHAAGFLASQLDDIERRGGAGLVIDLLLEPSALLRRRMELPIQLESSLRQSIAYQLNRLTPFSEADLYFDVVVRERDAANRKLQVELVAAPRSRVEPLLREMTRLCGREIDRSPRRTSVRRPTCSAAVAPGSGPTATSGCCWRCWDALRC